MRIRSDQLTQNHNQIGYAWYPRRSVASFPGEWSSEVTLWRHRVAVRFLPITFDRNELETWGWCHSVRLVNAHRLMCNMIYLGHTVTLTWRDLRSNFKIDLSGITKKNIWIDPAWREEYDGVKIIPLALVVSSWEVTHEKNISQKTYFFPFVTSRIYSICLTTNLRAQIDSGDPGLSFDYLTILLAGIVIAIFCENNPILEELTFFEPLWPQMCTWSKNDPGIFCRTCGGLSNSVYCLSLSVLVFEFSGGGGAVIRPSGRAKVAQTPGRARA